MIQYKNTKKTMKWQVVAFFIYVFCETAPGQIQYSILEELKQGSTVGNVAKDLGLDINDIPNRKLQITSQSKKQYFNINVETGNLYVIDRVDREAICEMEEVCLLNIEILAENPVNVYHVKIEIQDINDNAPIFSKAYFDIGISESASPGTHFVLGNARDPDLGTNSLQSYNLTSNQHFELGEKLSVEGIKYPELVLTKTLDREKQNFYELMLFASDGGIPRKTGTAIIRIVVQDVNDNFPIFNKEMYRIRLNEDVPIDFLILHLNATDEDEGSNAQITYSFSHIAENAKNTFSLDPQNGEIKTIGPLDFEVTRNYKMTVEAKDGGGLVVQCTILIQIVDINDNAPEIIVKSMFSPIPEDSQPGTLVALINVNDLDSEKNGEVTCQLAGTVPIKLISSSINYYKLVTTSALDRETACNYSLTIVAEDGGFPKMLTKKTIQLTISDVNDNPPVFEKINYITYVLEHNIPGTSIHHVHALDPDDSENARILYSIINKNIDGIPISSYISINSQTGVIYAQRPFDYEHLQEFQFKVMAKDTGSPPLSSNATVNIFIIDKNDNAPKILYPSTDTEGTSLFEFIPRSSEKDYLITKVIAVDADSGHNAWLSYHFLQTPDSPFFVISQNTGEIRLTRDLQDSDSFQEKVIVMVKDNGIPSLSATVTLNLVVAETFQEVHPEIIKQPTTIDNSYNVTFYLVLAIALISFLFILTVIVTIIAKCRKPTTSTAFGTLSRAWNYPLSLTYPSEFSDGSLPLPFTYDVCVTLDSKQNEIAYLKPVQNVPTDNLIDTGDPAIGDDSTHFPSTNIPEV